MTGAPSLKDALAIAIVRSRRCNAEACKWKERVDQLEQELAKSKPSHPLAQLGIGGPPSTELAACDLDSVSLWQQAAAHLPEEHLNFLNAAQRYLLLKEQAEQPAANPVPHVLARTPAQAALELASDILATHLAGGQGAAAAQGGLLLGEQHGQALEQGTACLAALAADPAGQLLSQDDGLCLSHFASYLLELACKPSPPTPGAAGEAGAAGGMGPPPLRQRPSQTTQSQPGSQPGAVGLDAAEAPIDLEHSSIATVARQVLARLCCCAGVGLLVLDAAARAVSLYIRRLVETVTGQPLPGGASAGGGSYASQETGEEGVGAGKDDGMDEEGLGYTAGQLLGLLTMLLPQLAGWVAKMGGCDELMSELTAALMAAQECCKLISVTHGSLARQMQSVAAQLVSALHAVAAAHGA